MAKNRKQDRSRQKATVAAGGPQQQEHSVTEPQSERGPQDAQHSSMEAPAEQRATQVTPGDVARKGRQKSFGHN